jgi:hypothetical protein
MHNTGAGKAINPSDGDYRSPQTFRRQPLAPVTERPKTHENEIPAFVGLVAKVEAAPTVSRTEAVKPVSPAQPAPKGGETISNRLRSLLELSEESMTTLDLKKRYELPYSTEQISTACRAMARAGTITQLPTPDGKPALYARKGWAIAPRNTALETVSDESVARTSVGNPVVFALDKLANSLSHKPRIADYEQKVSVLDRLAEILPGEYGEIVVVLCAIRADLQSAHGAE